MLPYEIIEATNEYEQLSDEQKIRFWRNALFESIHNQELPKGVKSADCDSLYFFACIAAMAQIQEKVWDDTEFIEAIRSTFRTECEKLGEENYANKFEALLGNW